LAVLPAGILELLDLAFLVDHVFADDRVEFHHFYLVRRVPLVFCGGIKMPGAGG